VRRRGWLLGLLTCGLFSLVVAPVSAVTTAPPQKVLTLSIPGPLTGCYYYAANTNDSLRAVLELVRPSAFTNDSAGNFLGASGPITQAELVSLTPQTVVYTLNTNWRWSNGLAFNGEDMLQWYERARALATSTVDGYRDIGSMTVSSTDDKVRVVFAQPYSDWTSLFRDVSQRDRPLTCTLTSLAAEPSLGPYVLQSISSTKADLVRNPLWKGPRVHFDRVLIRTGVNPSRFAGTNFVDYRSTLSANQLNELTNSATLDGHIGSSDQIVTVGFSPHRSLTTQLAVRQFLSWSLDRQRIIDQSIGALTYSQGLAASTLYSQSQHFYPGSLGTGPFNQSPVPINTAIPVSANQDCVTCAPSVLSAAGYVLKNSLWRTPRGTGLLLSVVVGPTPIDQLVASEVTAQWRRAGVAARMSSASSDHQVASMLAHGHADVGIFTLTTNLATSQTARSWVGSNYGDGVDIGWRSSLIDQWYSSALNTFNANDAATTWLEIDHQITTQAWERPLFTVPSIVTWSTNVAGVYGSVALQSFVDEIPTWGNAQPIVNPSPM
jgi:ABC-type transport system substrate-binding protein